MGETKHGTGIEWTHGEGFRGETWNPVTGCSKVSPGCAHCYAETLSLRYGWSKLPWTPENAAKNVVLHPERLNKPLTWRKPRMVFVNSMSDLFHELIPDDFIEQVFVVMARATHHTFQVLTKRPERALALLSDPGTRNFVVNRATSENTSQALARGWTGMVEDAQPRWPLPNVWMGTSIESSRFTWRADALRVCPAAVRFISAEPLLGSLFVGGPSPEFPETPPERYRAPLKLDGIDWVIVGGESGPGFRPMNLDHAREIRDACLYSCACPTDYSPAFDGTPEFGKHRIHLDGCLRPAFFFKQVGGHTPKSGGKLLDGREWCEMPEVAA